MTLRNYKTGWGVTDTLADIVHAGAAVTATQYMTFESPIGTDHQVATGKALYITALLASASGANSDFVIGYGDTGIPDQAAAPTNWVRLCQNYDILAANQQYEFPCHLVVPAGKYPCLLSITNDLRVQIIGIEI